MYRQTATYAQMVDAPVSLLFDRLKIMYKLQLLVNFKTQVFDVIGELYDDWYLLENVRISKVSEYKNEECAGRVTVLFDKLLKKNSTLGRKFYKI
jgi:hypothetical protein